MVTKYFLEINNSIDYTFIKINAAFKKVINQYDRHPY